MTSDPDKALDSPILEKITTLSRPNNQIWTGQLPLPTSSSPCNFWINPEGRLQREN